ncbi:CMGC family protein kinase [Trichomonas vaginalis G3]|uniref:non-specific serine/threonine protein kinase n=1 Tax=Trichomonas vaginalis (strain ATCC PRA-98 / G3) TaxID=412133 RepID=A2EZN0_TRIV3|nr:STKc GSK3 domain-containing protein [Trichomonas vaginalis G3]EAY01868.1 CMGC family protein kinase [Trichomonas vaginalis G3]KAI5549667.1 STKc GSK3 domain-containing protein [Trichomonas vaginalis G3]|eukprot:XP_001314412.1 CMGC family protein kinase [Trichomonas vaginalis G3]
MKARSCLRNKKRQPRKVDKIGNYTVMKKDFASGAFGSVAQCKTDDQQIVAIKKVIWNKSIKSQEYDILLSLDHRNIVKVYDHIVDSESNQSKVNEFIVMEYLNESLFDYMIEFNQNQKRIPMLDIKLFAYQIFSALNYIHSKGIAHCDLKPENILLDRSSGIIKVADFGSAQYITQASANNTYIVSRFYRAPELLIDAKQYDTAVDIWSTGCIIVEMLTGHTLFHSNNSDEQLKAILKVLGKPSFDDLHSIPHKKVVPQYRDQTTPIESIIPSNTPQDLKELLKSILVFNPKKRPTALECMNHKFFDELFVPDTTMPDGTPLPQLDRQNLK